MKGSSKMVVPLELFLLLGAEVLLYFTVAGANMSARVDSDTPARYGDHIELAFDPNKIHVFDKETELTITN